MPKLDTVRSRRASGHACNASTSSFPSPGAFAFDPRLPDLVCLIHGLALNLIEPADVPRRLLGRPARAPGA